MQITDLSGDQLLQIKQAARGAISGTLSEWPYLNNVLKLLGYTLPLNADAHFLRTICYMILNPNNVINISRLNVNDDD